MQSIVRLELDRIRANGADGDHAGSAIHCSPSIGFNGSPARASDAQNNPLTTVATANTVTVGGSLLVNSTGDGPTATGNTLRDAVAYANTLGAGTNAITFDPTVFAATQTITLSSTLGALTLSNASGTTTITAPAAGVTISGGNSVGLFTVNSGVTASFSNLTLIDGHSNIGGAIDDQGTLTISGSLLTGNAAEVGGAIAVSGAQRGITFIFAGTRMRLIHFGVSRIICCWPGPLSNRAVSSFPLRAVSSFPLRGWMECW
jgi:hypothetical protein